jgi:hypothetical protein
MRCSHHHHPNYCSYDYYRCCSADRWIACFEGLLGKIKWNYGSIFYSNVFRVFGPTKKSV